MNETIYYHGTTLPKSNPNINNFKTKKGYRHNSMTGLSREVKSPWVFFTDDFHLAQKFGAAKTDGLYHDKGDFSYKTVVLKCQIDESKLKILDLSNNDYITKIEKIIDNNLLIKMYGSVQAFYDIDIDDTWELLDDVEISNSIMKSGFNSIKLIENGGKSLAININVVNDVVKCDNLNESKIRGSIRKILKESLLKQQSEHTIKQQENFNPVQIDDDISDFISDWKRIKINNITFNFMRLNGVDKNKFVIETDDEGEIGGALLNCYNTNFNGCYLDNIRINPKYRRIGLASKMYEYIEGLIGEKLKPSPIKQSPEIKNFWRDKN